MGWRPSPKNFARFSSVNKRIAARHQSASSQVDIPSPMDEVREEDRHSRVATEEAAYSAGRKPSLEGM